MRDGSGRGSLWTAAGLTVFGTPIANYLVSVVAQAVFAIPPEFPPLAGAVPVIFFSVVSAVAAIGVFAIAGMSARPVGAFRKVAAVVLVASFVPDLLLLSDGAASAFPGATAAGVGALMVMHVVSAGIIVWAVERTR